jgi:hypothetical protein
MTRFFCWLGVVAAVASALPARAGDCKYVPSSEKAVKMRAALKAWIDDPKHDPNAMPPNPTLVAGAWVHEVHVVGCEPMCIGRVYCASEHPGESPTDAQKVTDQYSHVISCNARPHATPFHPNCPTADECMAAAKAESFRMPIAVSPATGGPTYFQVDKQNQSSPRYEFKYGLDREDPDQKIYLYTMQTTSGGDPKACHVCTAPVTLGAALWSYTACPASGSDQKGCDNANACVAASSPDPNLPVDDPAGDATSYTVIALGSNPDVPPASGGAAPPKSSIAHPANPGGGGGH